MPKVLKHPEAQKPKRQTRKTTQHAKLKSRTSKVSKQAKASKMQHAKQLNFSVFYEDYIPPKLVIRDKQVEQIKQTIDNFSKNGIAPNLQLQGVTGSGKTSTLMYVLRSYDPKLFTLIKCKQTKGIKEVLAQLAGLKPLARQRAPELMPEIIKVLKKDKRIIVIDDVTAVSSWLDLMGYLDGIFREVQTPIIVTTNVFKFLDRLPEDVRHTLLFFRVDFPAYNAIDLYNIVKDRVELSGARFPDESLHIIAAGAAQVGSARDALTMTRTAIQQSRTDQKSIAELQHIMEEQTYLDYVSKLAPKERQVLSYIIQRYAKSRRGIPIRDITRDLRLSPSRTSQLVTGLEQYEVIQTRTEHQGGGNYRVIELDETLADKAAKGEIDTSQF